MVPNGGRAKASVHHDPQSNDGVGSGKGSETACFLGAESEPRGFLTVGSSELDSDSRLFRGCGGEGEDSLMVGVVNGVREWEGPDVCPGDGALK